MKRKQLFLLLGVATLAGLAWWKRDQLFGTPAVPDAGNAVAVPPPTNFTSSLANNSAASGDTNSSALMPPAAAQAAATTAATTTAASNAAATNNATNATPAPSTDWGALSVFADAYQTWIARGKKKDRPNTEKNLARFEKRYERKHQVQVGSSVSLAGGVTPPTS